jgi:hypothetical protein
MNIRVTNVTIIGMSRLPSQNGMSQLKLHAKSAELKLGAKSALPA